MVQRSISRLLRCLMVTELAVGISFVLYVSAPAAWLGNRVASSLVPESVSNL